ncbi:MAG: aldehyde dehydrogenase family protein [Candidatus Marinimicrobia bacterium]|nr:aldehyde dehydrogenase family protein [Candidatus Neomarinimicrobiota bacterium]
MNLESLGIKKINSGACIGGKKWIDCSKNKSFTSYSPGSLDRISDVQIADKAIYSDIVLASQKAFKSWRMLPAPKRGELIYQISLKLRQHKDSLGSLISYEMGKIKSEGDGEVQEMIDLADFAVGLSRQLYGLTMHSERPNHRMYEQWHPLGIVGVITAFNFPMAVWAWNAFIAAVCGDVVIWKPSLKTPLCAIAVQNICNEVLIENGYKGIFNLIIGEDSNIGEEIVSDRRIPLISATGSTKMGKIVAQKVGSRLGKTILELGGNNGIIVDEDSNLDLVIPAIVFGAVGTAGQRCTSTRRVFIHKNQFNLISNKLVAAYKQVKIGDPLLPDTLMGPLIDKDAVNGYLNAIENALSQGGELLYGGSKLESLKGSFVEPAIIKAESHFEIVKQETFAPILYLIEYENMDEAIKEHNNVSQGLSSSIFTNNVINSEKFLSAMGSDCGIANVNIGTSGAEIGGAFGGEKDTGGGRESGSDSWKAYMRRQTNTVNWSLDLPLAQGIKFNLE